MCIRDRRLDKQVKYPIQGRTGLRKQPGASDTKPPANEKATSDVKPQSKTRKKKKFRRIKLRATIQHEAHALANQLLGKDDIPKIVETQALFDDANS